MESYLLELIHRRGLAIREWPLKGNYEHIRIYRLDLANLMIFPVAADALLFAIAPGAGLDADAAALIEEILTSNGYTDRLKIVEYSQATEEGLSALGQLPMLIAVSRADLAEIKGTQPLTRYLQQRFVKASSLASLNPYTYQGPVTGSRFFGRDNELATLRLQRNRSFVITGMRRSGKTSLLLELNRRIQLSDDSGEIVVFVNFENCYRLADVPYLVLRRIADQLPAEIPVLASWREDLLRLSHSRMWGSVQNLPRLGDTLWKLANASEATSRLRFLFDEYDRVLELERREHYLLTRLWRDLIARPEVSTGRRRSSPTFLQFTFAGSRKLYEELLSRESPLYNFAVRLALQNFDVKTLAELVSRPLREVGVTVQDPPGIAQALLELTGGHPATAQHLCSLVVEDPQVERTRHAGVQDVRRASTNPRFLGQFKSTIERNISPLGRFILAQMAVHKRSKVNVHFVRDVSRKYHVVLDEREINIELEGLADSGYLRDVDFAAGHSVYMLEVPTVPLLFSSTDADNLVGEMLAEGICRRS